MIPPPGLTRLEVVLLLLLLVLVLGDVAAIAWAYCQATSFCH